MCLSGYDTEVARTPEAIEMLREAWNTMPSRIEADIDFFLEFIKVHNDSVLRPHVIVLRKGTQVVAILPGRLERHSLRVRAGYKDLHLPRVSQITFVGQLLGEDSKEAATEAMKSALVSLRRNEADVALFHHLDFEKPLHRVVEQAGHILTKDYFTDSEESWKTQIPGNYEVFLRSRSSNTRYNIKRYSKRLLQAFPGKVQYKVRRNPADLDVVFEHCEAIASKSYLRGMRVGFADDVGTRRILALAAARGWLRSYILYLDGRPSAFWNGFLYRNSFVIRDTAYDAALSELRPGHYLLQRLMEDLCACGSVRELDFGPGAAQYKREMGDVSSQRISQLLFAPTLKGVSINLLRTPPLAFSGGAKWLLRQSGFFGKARRMWRARLVAKASVDSRATVSELENLKDG